MTERPTPPARRRRVAVLAGGDSPEREVSLNSGRAVTRALTVRGHRARQIDPAVTDPAEIDWSLYDAAFLALHGPYGEDGTIQEILERTGVPYTGSDAATSRLAFSKSAAKERFIHHKVPTPPYVLVHSADARDRIRAQAERIGYPLVVKPDAQGSSIGVTIVPSPAALEAAVAECFRFGSFGLIEKAIIGTEWTVGMLDDVLLPACRITSRREFYDYAAKYQDDDTRYEFEFDLPRETVAAIEHAGRDACRALGTRGMARADLRVDEQLRPWVLEVNTIPGLTDHSLVPKAAARIGLSFGDLCERALDSALSPSPRATPRGITAPLATR
ncbi:MAG: D-alanine--D-alanine ligase [Planctomycetales bacterium]